MSPVQIFDIFFIAAVVSYLVTPFIRMLAVKLDYLDHPKDNKVHAHPTALLGGVAIFIAFIVAVLTKDPAIHSQPVRALLLGTLILLVIGLIDDKMGMMPNVKLLGQFLAAMVVIKSGLRMEFIGNYYIGVILSYVWIIGITNSFNLLDNMNGLSAGIACISSIFFGIIGYMNGQFVVSAVSFAAAGSAIGFLKHNFPKANIFMGDSGSLILGYIVAVVAMMCSWKTSQINTSILIPLLILGFPIFDTTLVSVMRILEGRSVFQGGKDHSSHRIALLGFKRYRTVLVVYLCCIALGLAAIYIARANWMNGIIVSLAAFFLMLALGVRLSLVDTKRYGRKKGVNGTTL